MKQSWSLNYFQLVDIEADRSRSLYLPRLRETIHKKHNYLELYKSFLETPVGLALKKNVGRNKSALNTSLLVYVLCKCTNANASLLVYYRFTNF